MILQILFSIDLGESDSRDLIPFLMKELAVPRRVVQEAWDIAIKVWEERQILDQKIQETSTDYAFNRIGSVERNVLRLGLFEILNKKLPDEVVLSESVRLARKFSTPEAADFVNAVLDSMRPPSEIEEGEPTTAASLEIASVS